MKKTVFHLASVLFLSMGLITSCLERQYVEQVPLLEVSKDGITVDSDSPSGRNMLSDTIVVSTNRSWSAVLVPEVDWATLSTAGNTDFSKTGQTDSLFISFLDNEAEEDRTVDLKLTTEDGDKTIAITQSAIRYRASITSDIAELSSIGYEATRKTICFNTNTEWTVSTKEGSEIDLSYSKTSGKYSGSFDVILPENEDVSSKNATVVFSAKGCSPIEIPLTQLKGMPYFSLLQDASVSAEEGLPNYSVKFKTNAAWTAEIQTLEGFASKDVSLSSAKGEKTQSGSITVKFPYCIAFGSIGKIVVKFVVEGLEEPVLQTITQIPVVRMRFWDAVKNAQVPSADWPTASPTYKQLPTKDADALHKAEVFNIVLTNGLQFEMFSTMGVVRYSKGGIVFGKGIGDYIAFPAFEGVRLVKMVFVFGNTTNLTADIRDPKGNALPGTEMSFAALGDKAVLTFAGTENNTSYKMYSTAKVKSGIRDLILYYE